MQYSVPGTAIYIPLCFYLYCIRRYFHCVTYHIYIPLCFYLYGLLNRHCFSVRPHLHSTMLLLIRRDILTCYDQFVDLHSTMLLLILPSMISTDWLVILFTFHYASTYTDNVSSFGRKVIHLHSTMLLLIQIWVFGSDRQLLIYIPLCFYLYSSYSRRVRSSYSIYIPLCFYLYTMQEVGHFRIQNLHSTMLLLILVPLKISNAQNKIYIPLCFYLYFGLISAFLIKY